MRTLAILLASFAVLCVGTFFVIKSRQERNELTDQVRSTAPGKFIDLEHGRVHYVLGGPEKSEVIIFIHGGGVTGMEVWRRNLPYFVHKGYRVLAYDLYGRGFTDRPQIEHAPEVFLSQLTALIDSLDLQPPFHLVSMSMGSIVALDYAKLFPENVAKLVIIDPAISGDFRLNPLLKMPVISDILLTAYWYPRAVANQKKEFADKALFKSYSERLRYFMAFKGYKHTNRSTWQYMLTQNRLDYMNALPLSHILLIYGDEDPYFRTQECQKIHSKLPGLQTVRIEWAGHMPHFEKPLEVNHAIHSFFRGVDEFRFSTYQ